MTGSFQCLSVDRFSTQQVVVEFLFSKQYSSSQTVANSAASYQPSGCYCFRFSEEYHRSLRPTTCFELRYPPWSSSTEPSPRELAAVQFICASWEDGSSTVQSNAIERQTLRLRDLKCFCRPFALKTRPTCSSKHHWSKCHWAKFLLISLWNQILSYLAGRRKSRFGRW